MDAAGSRTGTATGTATGTPAGAATGAAAGTDSRNAAGFHGRDRIGPGTQIWRRRLAPATGHSPYRRSGYAASHSWRYPLRTTCRGVAPLLPIGPNTLRNL